MTEKDIAYKYTHGLHDCLTDRQERIEIEKDILDFAKDYHKKQCKEDEYPYTFTIDLNKCKPFVLLEGENLLLNKNEDGTFTKINKV